MDKGFDSWEDAGTHLFSGDNMWSSALPEDDDFVNHQEMPAAHQIHQCHLMGSHQQFRW
jgi:hypothetical protein